MEKGGNLQCFGPGSNPRGCIILGFFGLKKKTRKIGKNPKNRRFHRKLPEISSNRLSVEDIVSTSTDKRKIGDISPIFGEILFLAWQRLQDKYSMYVAMLCQDITIWLLPNSKFSPLRAHAQEPYKKNTV